MSEEQEIRSAVDEAKNPKTFSIINVINDRAYPKGKIVVSMDEATAYEAALVKEELDEIGQSPNSKSAIKQKRVEELTEKLEELTEKMNESSYTFHIKGISEGRREELASEAKKKYPIEYERPSDLSALIGNQQERTEKPSPERDNLFTDLLWMEQIEKIESPDGAIQDSFSYTDARALRHGLPLSSLAKINSAIEKIRTATAVFMMETGEDFLAKP